MIKKCLICSKEFNVKPYRIKDGTAKFCSYVCKYASQTSKIETKCFQCNNIFYTVLSSIKRGHGKFCSVKCSSTYHSINWRGKRHQNFINGRIKTSAGYVAILNYTHPHRQNNYIREHRFIVEKYIRRYLLRKEEVHHINHIKSDNRINNLMAFSSKSAHLRFHKNPNSVKKEEIIFDGRFINT